MAESRHSSADGKLKQGQLFLRQQQQRLKEQNQILFQLHRRREEQMRILTSQLLLLEANLRQKQSRIDVLLNQRDGIIFDQNERIRILERDLAEAHRKLNSITVDEKPEVVTTEEEATPNKEEIVSSPPPQPKPDAKGLTRNLIRLLGRDDEESLEDSDSAVVIEDGDHLNTSPTQQIKVIRSISDVVACARANILVSRDPIQRIKSLPIPQDEEEGGEEGDEASSSSEDSPFNQRGPKSFLRGSLERTPIHQPTLHRSLSSSIPRSHCINHRSVTRPRDVKSKRTTRMTTRPPPTPTHLLSRTHSFEGSSYPDIRLSPFLPSSRV